MTKLPSPRGSINFCSSLRRWLNPIRIYDIFRGYFRSPVRIYQDIVGNFGRILRLLSPQLCGKLRWLDSAFVFITEHCSLKCTYCNALMQYYKNPNHISVEQICLDIDNTFAKINYLFHFGFLGGEPFLHDKLDEILIHARKYKKQYARLTVTTNGTIVPKQRVLNALKESNCFVFISDYGDNSRKILELCNALNSNRIPFTKVRLQWKVFHIPSEKDEDNAKTTWKFCKKFMCKQIKNGKIYYCCFLSNGESLGVFPYDPDNAVLLTDTDDNVWKYLLRKDYPPGCAYCGGDGHGVSAGEDQCKYPIAYNRLDELSCIVHKAKRG